MTLLQIGDKVKLNSRYFKEGLAYFGKELKYPRQENHFFTVKNICEDVIEIDGGNYKEIDVIWKHFLQKIN